MNRDGRGRVLRPRPAPRLLSLVIPVFEEREGLPFLRESLDVFRRSIGVACEVILVDDGSRDDSWAFISGWAAEDSRVRGIALSKNFGHQAAATAGLAASRGDAVVLLDADLQDPLNVIPAMLEKYREGYDVVYGRRSARDGETSFKRFTAWLFYRLMRALVHRDLPPDTGDFRLVSRRCLVAVLRMNETHRFLRGLFAWIGFPQSEVVYRRQARRYGVTKYPLWKMVRLAWNAALSFSTLPVKLITMMGFATALFALGYGAYAVVGKYAFHSTVPGWTGLVVLFGLVGAAILLGLGVIGEYVGRIFEEVKGRPLYVVCDDTSEESALTECSEPP
jgi:dolichol-phosphate mannosyltransferase